MPKEYFQIQKTTPLADIPKGGKIHIIGVAGVAMGQLAVALAKQGYRVSGSDKRFYEPMGSFLRNSPVELCDGYHAKNVPEDVSLVVIGNAVSYGHAEVDVVESKNIPYTLFPKLLAETVIGERTSLVACGTHGKSTTTALLAGALRELGKDPSYFIGGVSFDLPSSLHVGADEFSVVEGDEYDSAFFAKVPKFKFYKPDTAIINAIEFDHADIYPTIEAIKEQFEGLLMQLDKNSFAICCIDFDEVRSLLKECAGRIHANIVTFGTSPDADFVITSRSFENNFQKVEVNSEQTGPFAFTTSLIGEYNARNALAVVISCLSNGISLEHATEVMPKLLGVKRRQQIRADNAGVLLIEDFAHHPTAVEQTIAAVGERYPDRRIIALFEPRSAASRRKIFQQDYIEAFRNAEHAIISSIENTAYDEGHELLDISQLSEDITQSGTPCEAIDGAEAIAESTLGRIESGDIVLTMSNGSFGGLIDILRREIEAREE